MKKVTKGDKIAILSPASVISPDYVAGAVETLRSWGFVPEVEPHTLDRSGSFSATAEERLSDFRQALLDPEVKAIICSRGGYGCVHLLPALDQTLSEMSARGMEPKTLVGFSDVSALHALWGKYGWPSIHASMTKHLALQGPADELNLKLLEFLTGSAQQESLTLPTGWSGSEYCKLSRPGIASGVVVGGNMAVIGGLIGTDFNPVKPGTILLMEDIAEPIYKVERILWQLRLAGIFDRLAGLIVGQFTDYRFPSADHQDMYQMIDRFIGDMGLPVAMDVPVGHIDDNHPVILNRRARMVVGEGAVEVVYD